METKKEMKELLWGISTNGDMPKWDEVWEEVTENDEEIIFQTIETFKHEESILTFDYKYVIRLSQFWDYDEDDNDIERVAMGLYLVPTVESIYENTINKLKEWMGEDNVDIAMIVQELICPLLRYKNYVIGKDFKLEGWYSENIEDFLSKAGVCIEVINSLRGFELDRYQNPIGTTGWEVVRELVLGEDATQATLKRWEEEKKEG